MGNPRRPGREGLVQVFQVRHRKPLVGEDGVRVDEAEPPLRTALAVLIMMPASKSPRAELSVSQRREGNILTVIPRTDDDLVGVALMQALVSGDCGPSLLESGLAIIRVLGSSRLGSFTRAGLEAQVVPLVPLASRYRFADGLAEGQAVVRERVQVRDVESSATKGITIQLDIR